MAVACFYHHRFEMATALVRAREFGFAQASSGSSKKTALIKLGSIGKAEEVAASTAFCARTTATPARRRSSNNACWDTGRAGDLFGLVRMHQLHSLATSLAAHVITHAGKWR